MATITIRDEFVRCGRKGCISCPHGPYRYSYQKIDGKLVKKYLGKSYTLSGQKAEPAAQIAPARQSVPDESVHALVLVLTRKTFVSCRNRFRAALRNATRDGASDAAIEVRRLWQEAWGSRR